MFTIGLIHAVLFRIKTKRELAKEKYKIEIKYATVFPNLTFFIFISTETSYAKYTRSFA